MNLNSRAADLNQATSDIVTAASHQNAHRKVAPASNRFGSAYEQFIDGGLEMAGVTKDTGTQDQVCRPLYQVFMSARPCLEDPT